MGDARKALLVASTGGHLEQLTRLERAMRPAVNEAEYATFDDPQSRSLLAGRCVHTVDYIPPRGLAKALQAERPALRILRDGGFTDVVSTGSAIAVPFLSAASMLGLRCHYIESAARAEGPSLSGRLVSTLPGIYLYTQYPFWAERRWQYRGSVFDRYHLSPRASRASLATDSGRINRVVVTLGTMRRYPFTRAVRAVQRTLAALGAADREILWQVGDTPAEGLGIDAHRLVPAADLRAAIREADLVVAHAGIGSCLQILDAGRAPVLLPRRASLGEHVDDHQRMIAFELDRRRLAVSRDPDLLEAADVVEATSRRVVSDPDSAVPFRLQGFGRAAWEDETVADTSWQPSAQAV